MRAEPERAGFLDSKLVGVHGERRDSRAEFFGIREPFRGLREWKRVDGFDLGDVREEFVDSAFDVSHQSFGIVLGWVR